MLLLLFGNYFGVGGGGNVGDKSFECVTLNCVRLLSIPVSV